MKGLTQFSQIFQGHDSITRDNLPAFLYGFTNENKQKALKQFYPIVLTYL